MLETRELVKIYKPKKGVPVTALDRISLKFPQKGMVFLLGKSGSGKSTLLNVLGGLDKYDGGEIIIKGVSSKNFKQQHFDSYRNTYVGFIFQEYNVLDEFSVGANIALAIELQGRKASDEEINRILCEVDLEGFGNRKPNELSGGQKQRVAIARALVKNPEIIMADEPTGALDSNTGKQVLDTLKKLSAKKLVIVVSHDREFAENYADRIIELSDGHVISDVEANSDIAVETGEEEGLSYNGNTVEISAGYHLTEDDRNAINEYIEMLGNGKLELTVKSKSKGGKRFSETDVSKIKTESGDGFKLIKSKLPMGNAFKIGASGLKYKKIRLVITILLSCVAFGLFGLADTFGAYNHVRTCTDSLYDTGSKYVPMGKAKKIGSGIDSYWRDYGFRLSEKELSEITKNSGVKVEGIYNQIGGVSLDFSNSIDSEVKLTETDYSVYGQTFNGYGTVNDKILKEMDMSVLAGVLPDGTKNEIAISDYIFETFKKAGYFDGKTYTKNAKGEQKPVYTKINSYGDIIGNELKMDDQSFKITAVINTGFDIKRYESLAKAKKNQSKADKLVDFVLYNEFNSSVTYSYASVMMVGDGYVDKLIANRLPITPITEGYISFYSESENGGAGVDSQYLARLEDIKNYKINWIDGVKTTLGEKEIIVTSDALSFESDTSVHINGAAYLVPPDGESGENGGEEKTDYAKLLKGKNKVTAFISDYNDYKDDSGYKIVGVIDINEKANNGLISTVVCSDKLFNKMTEGTDKIYDFAIGAMPEQKEEIRNMVSYCYREDSNVRYQIQNAVTYELDSVNDVLKTLSKYFLYIGLGFALFAALMLANFIGTSISYKKQEIGILRAIGSRSNDVFRIFFAESFVIAMINFVLSGIGVFSVVQLINYLIRHEAGILVTVLRFDIRQVLLLLAVSILVAFVASFLPVKKIASKRPIDAIRNR